MNHDSFSLQITDFLNGAGNGDFLCFRDPSDSDQLVQYLLRSDRLVGEVGSRQWNPQVEARRPLSRSAERALRALSVTEGGPEANYFHGHLPKDPKLLAGLTRTLFALAYGEATWVFADVITTCQMSPAASLHCSSIEVVASRREGPCLCDHLHRDEPPIDAPPALAARAHRMLLSAFADVVLHCEDRALFRKVVEQVRTFDDLPSWATAWVTKSEEGPLQLEIGVQS